MTNIKEILFCTSVNFRKWIINPRIYTLAIVIVAFLAYHSYGLSQFAADRSVGITPWIFPHLTTPPVIQVFACLTVLLFADAPFADRHMPFLVIRTGRRHWAIGQLLYIIIAAAVYTLFIYIVSVIVFIPNLQFTFDWGILINSLAMNPSIAPETITIFVIEDIVTTLTALEATLISLSLFWLVSVFIGVLIFFFNIWIEKASGIIAAGVFIFLSFFSIIHGRLMLGDWLLYITPISWMNIYQVFFSTSDISGTSLSPTYIFTFLIGTILMMSIVAVNVFCKKDVKVHEED